MSSIKERIVRLYAKTLADEGEKIIVRASALNDTTPRTFNMRDAYGCAVYYQGRLIEKRYVTPIPMSTEIHRGWKEKGIEDNTGRGYLNDFLSSYKATPFGLTMICVNVIYYTSILENGKQGNGVDPVKKYRIISEMDIDFARLSNKYKGSRAFKITL